MSKECLNIGHRLESATKSIDGPYKCTRPGCGYELKQVLPDMYPVYPPDDGGAHGGQYKLIRRTCDIIVKKKEWSLNNGYMIPLSALDRTSLKRLKSWLALQRGVWKYTTDVEPKVSGALSVVKELLE